MSNSTSLPKKSLKVFLFLIVLLSSPGLLLPISGFCQETAATKLEKMPVDLERDYALSSLPPRLRKAATVYLLDPAKGYYVAQKGCGCSSYEGIRKIYGHTDQRYRDSPDKKGRIQGRVEGGRILYAGAGDARLPWQTDQ